MSSIPFKINNKVLNYLINLILNLENNKLNKEIINDLCLSVHPKSSLLSEYKKEVNKCVNNNKNSKVKTYDEINNFSKYYS